MKYELGEEVGRRHFGYTLSAKAKKGELKGDEVAVKVILKAKSVFEVGIRSSWPRHEVIVAEKKDDIYGILSLILYTMILIPMIKYIFIVLLADNNNDGGTFALYTLISWYAKVSLIPNEQAEDAMRSNYKLETISPQMKRAQWIKRKPEGSIVAKYILFLLTVLGNSMVIGDGILTPCISVLSAVSGIKQKAPSLSESTIAILVLFSVQYFVTDKVGYSFAPIILLWFLLLGGIGLYDLIHYNAHVLHAFNAKYIFDYFKRNGKRGWVSLGGVVLCITAMFADPGHFNVRAIQISFTTILFPSGTLAYLGQAVYLTKFPEHVVDTFYRSIPGPLFWPTIVVAISSSIIASQAMIDFCWFCNHLSVPKSRLFLKSYYCTHFLQGRMTSLYS